jgi:hypothetical protein
MATFVFPDRRDRTRWQSERNSLVREAIPQGEDKVFAVQNIGMAALEKRER